MRNFTTQNPGTNNTQTFTISSTITKRISTTNYIINVFSATDSKESVSDKVLRLIENDAAKMT